MKTLSAEALAIIAQHATDFETKITHFGKQVAPETTQAGIAYVNMISQVRIADALESIAASLAGQTPQIDPEGAIG